MRLGVPAISREIPCSSSPKPFCDLAWLGMGRASERASRLSKNSRPSARALRGLSFRMLVDRINHVPARPSSDFTFIDVHDTVGFEIFDVNGYEQLRINYINEKLRQCFYHHMFVFEQEYVREGFDGATIGVLSLFNEECIMLQPTDRTFTNKRHAIWATEPQARAGEEPHPATFKYEHAVRAGLHRAPLREAGRVPHRRLAEDPHGPCSTTTSCWSLSPPPSATSCPFAESSDMPLSTGTSASAATTIGKKRETKNGAFRHVAQRHKEQLSALMARLQGTQPHFVRCIVPNTLKKPGRVDVPLVLDELRCNGVLEDIRIARLGHPKRLPFVEFRQRYEVLTPGIIPTATWMTARRGPTHSRERRDALLFDIFSRLQQIHRAEADEEYLELRGRDMVDWAECKDLR
ncbi:P-loop containing nucleoside triphosphate hydrolase protein [Dichomitus squalens]|uniref:P-loop containing nucleoside triphosphate hydrolase protein n=1 Tax=Dichomitus squalens TaxID=114155 RepID=A0A4Q9PMM8_9APHY|nr:P-loop containing nucleoside triphosphate hydrolase protein [Dichomitus squalens]